MEPYIPKILIVDDLPQNLILLEAILKGSDVRIVKADSGKAALKAIEHHTFSLALLDVHMPEMNGFELAEKIHQNDNHNLLPIIFVTANNLDDLSVSMGYHSGAVDYITKPLKRDILISKVKIFTDIARQQNEMIEQSEKLDELFKDQMIAQNTISEQLKLEQAYSKISSIFVGNFELNDSIKETMKIISEYIKASGAVMYDFKPVQNKFEQQLVWRINADITIDENLDKLFVNNIEESYNELRQKKLVKNAAQILAPTTDYLMLPIHVFGELQVVLIFFNREYALRFFDKYQSVEIFTDLISSALERMEVHKKLQHKERLAGIGEIATGIAHELNQPLNIISLGLDNILLAIKAGKATDEYLHKKTKKIHESIERTRSIIDHVRTFSRDQDDYINSEFSINESIDNALSMVSEQYINHGVMLESTFAENLPVTTGNTYKFEEVILNFLSNAMHAVESRKEMEDTSYVGRINIVTYQQNEHIIVEVKDNGSGIADHIIDKIMQPFFTTKEEGKGTGLGLSIAFGIIKDMKGTIDISSTEGKGTNVKISLPSNN